MAWQVRIKCLIDFADHEVVVDYRGFGLGWSWHGVEVTPVSSGGFKTPNLAFPQSLDCQDGVHSAHGSHGSLEDQLY